jgi:hypothetical protein
MLYHRTRWYLRSETKRLPGKQKEIFGLSSRQDKVIQLITKRAKRMSMKAIQKNKRVSKKHFLKMLEHIRTKSQIRIQFAACDLNQILKDGYYGNLFQTNKSNGAFLPQARILNEFIHFRYPQKSTPSKERCKYGHLATTCSENICLSSVGGYGECFFILKSTLNEKISVCYGDSLGATKAKMSFGTLKHYAHILNDYISDDFQKLYRAACCNVSDAKEIFYKEVQIHQDVILKKHVENLVVPKAYATQKLQDKCKSFGIKLFGY